MLRRRVPAQTEGAMGIAERKEREFQQRERRILDAALALFAGDDWHAVTVEQIAERAEIGKGTVYKHFAGKDEIYARLAAEFESQALERLDRIDRTLPVIQRLRALIAVIWEQHSGAGHYERLVEYCEREDFRRGLSPEARAELSNLDARFEAHIHGVLRDGIEQGILPRKPLPALLFGPTSALRGAVRMIRMGWLEGDLNAQPQLDELTNFILAGMLYQEWLADEGFGDDEATRRAETELRQVEAELADGERRGNGSRTTD